MRILIADDHPIICIALDEMLRTAFAQTATSIQSSATAMPSDPSERRARCPYPGVFSFFGS